MEALHGLRLGLGSVSAIQDQVSQALEQPVRTAQRYVHQQPASSLPSISHPQLDGHVHTARSERLAVGREGD